MDIPEDTFLRHYHAARRYVGFKYVGVGLWLWRAGGENRGSALDSLIADALGEDA